MRVINSAAGHPVGLMLQSLRGQRIEGDGIEEDSMSLSNIVFILMVVCFLIEQVIYWFPGSYPYRYGIKISSIHFPGLDKALPASTNKLSINTRSDGSEIYLKYKYPPLTMGPSIFIGQIKTSDPQGVLHIRIGPVSALFVLYLFAVSIFSPNMDTFYQITNIAMLIIAVTYFYYRLLSRIYSILPYNRHN